MQINTPLVLSKDFSQDSTGSPSDRLSGNNDAIWLDMFECLWVCAVPARPVVF